MIKANAEKEEGKKKVSIEIISSGADINNINSSLCCLGPYTIIW